MKLEGHDAYARHSTIRHCKCLAKHLQCMIILLVITARIRLTKAKDVCLTAVELLIIHRSSA